MFKFLEEPHPATTFTYQMEIYIKYTYYNTSFSSCSRRLVKSLALFFLLVGIDWQVRPPLSGLPTRGKMSLNKESHFNTSIANLVILRGKDVHSAELGKQS